MEKTLTLLVQKTLIEQMITKKMWKGRDEKKKVYDEKYSV